MTRQQRWAKGALERILTYKDQPQEGDYRTLCMKMPVLIKQSGLVQAIAFVWSRDKEIGKSFCNDLAEVYRLDKEPGHVLLDEESGRALLGEAQKAALTEYLALTRDIIAVSVWFRRFAQSEIKAVSP